MLTRSNWSLRHELRAQRGRSGGRDSQTVISLGSVVAVLVLEIVLSGIGPNEVVRSVAGAATPPPPVTATELGSPLTVSSPVGPGVRLGQMFSASELIQLLGVVATFFAAFVALFGEGIRKWWNRPKLKLMFSESSDRCFRTATISGDHIQGNKASENTTRQYYRLRVTNTGGPARRLRVRADILDKDWNKLERFEPSVLRWLGKSDTVDLATGESHYVNFLSQIIKTTGSVERRLRIELYDFSPRAIAWDRPLKVYNYQLIIHGDNVFPKSYVATFTPTDDDTEPGHLVVRPAKGDEVPG